MSSKYREHKQLNLPAIGQEILAKWQQDHTFEASMQPKPGGKGPFVFYEGPPSANGMPGIHHVISRTLKDLVCRYKTMQGYEVKRKGGWDTHGLPVELGVEKELGITKEDIGVKISVEDYNKKCREVVMRFKDKWDSITQQMGYWVDLNDPYITFDNKYIETLWWCLSQLYKKGYLYESVSIQPYSPAAGTGLSSHELNQPGTYKDVKDTSATVMFKVENPQFNVEGDVYLMAWTTTPWTLPSNLGLTVGPNIEYVLVKTFNPYTHALQHVILAKDLLPKYFKAEGENGDFEAYTKESKIIPYTIINSFTGQQLEGLRYQQLIPGEANTLAVIQDITPRADPFRVVTGDFVTTTDGTGIVHTAPAFGADDFKVGKQNNLGILTLVDKEGKFVPGLGEYSGRYVKDYKDEPDYKDVNVDISVELKLRGQAFKVEKYEHSYPHCWRTDKPIVYYPLDAWFIKTTALKDKMVEANKTINWKPKATGEGRFGNWLENMVDWNLSRSRFWGTPLPIWKKGSFNDKDEFVIGSISELKGIGKYFDTERLTNDIKNDVGEASILYKEIGNQLNVDNPNVDHPNITSRISYHALCSKIKEKEKVLSVSEFMHGGIPFDILKNYLNDLPENFDLHKPFVDNIICIKNESDYYYRVPDLVDVWFDSGAMPYAQYHFPFENKELFAQNYPADFIAEGVDQTRGWFYTLHALAALLQESVEEELQKDGITSHATGVAYKNVVSNGLVLDKNGLKMSKRLGNVVDPFATIDQYGADATRWYLITNASPWDSLKFDLEGIKEVQRKFFGTLYNTYQFFALYANVDGFAFKETYVPVAERPELDRWILSALNTLVQTVQQSMDDYEPTQAGRAIEEFTDVQLSNWYVRLCRRRFWKGEYEHDKICAYQTLYECLETLSRLIAPIAPFFADWLFHNLNTVSGRFSENSVHLVLFPTVDISIINAELEQRMALGQDASSLVLSLRKKVNIKVRQPLQKVMIPALDAAMTAHIQQVADIIKAETNVKEIEILSAENNFIRKKAKANFKTLGKRLGAKMKWAADKIAQFTNADIEKALQEPFVLDAAVLGEDGQPITITAEDMEASTDAVPGYEVATKGPLTVALDITITDKLKKEGNAREFVNRIQAIRKDEGFALTDRINVKVSENGGLQASLTEFNAYICAEILADLLEFTATLTDGTEIEVNDVLLKVNVTKKGV